jgi:predicted component of type VI protein secretion system
MQPPAHPIPALTTYELAAYRRELEHALTLPATAREDLRRQLAAVLAEQESRAQIAASGQA